MKRQEANIEIKAPKKKVWDNMVHPETYREWISAAFPGSYFEGTWAKGENVKFLSPGQGGTLGKMVECIPYDTIVIEHIAVINADGSEDRDSATAKGWIGTSEGYQFTEQNGKTTLTTWIKTTPEFEEMLKDWPKALAKLKEMCEQ